MSDTPETFTCANCGIGEVIPVSASGQKMLYRNFPALSLPDELTIPTCSRCGEQWFDDETLKSVDSALKTEAQRVRHLIAAEALRLLSLSSNQRDIEATLDLSPGYLSKVKHGKESPSATLVALLALLACRPARLREIERVWSAGKIPVRAPVTASVTGYESVPTELPELAEAV